MYHTNFTSFELGEQTSIDNLKYVDKNIVLKAYQDLVEIPNHTKVNDYVSVLLPSTIPSIRNTNPTQHGCPLR